MKLVTFTLTDDRRRLGVLTPDEAAVIDLSVMAERRPDLLRPETATMRGLIRAGQAGLERVRELTAIALSDGDPDARPSIDRVRLRLPLDDPPMLRCCSLFLGHYRNVHRTLAAWRGETIDSRDVTPPPLFLARPGWYKGNPLSLIGPGDEIVPPSYGGRLDFELELALIVGSDGVDVTPARFQDHVFGWSVFNDVSARHPQIEEMGLGVGPYKGKDFDTGNILGPCIVTADAFDPATAKAIARVNGVEWGRGDASDMAHGWPEILALRSRSERLHPGEIITSGAFSNCSGIEHDRFLSPGDRIDLEIPGIGVLSNTVARPA